MAKATSMLEVSQRDDVCVVAFKDRLVQPHHLVSMERELNALVEQVGGGNVVVSFDGVDYFPSTGLGVLIAAHTRLRKRGGQMRLADTMPLVREMFGISGLDRLFTIDPDVETAVAAFTEEANG